MAPLETVVARQPRRRRRCVLIRPTSVCKNRRRYPAVGGVLHYPFSGRDALTLVMRVGGKLATVHVIHGSLIALGALLLDRNGDGAVSQSCLCFHHLTSSVPAVAIFVAVQHAFSTHYHDTIARWKGYGDEDVHRRTTAMGLYASAMTSWEGRRVCISKTQRSRRACCTL